MAPKRPGMYQNQLKRWNPSEVAARSESKNVSVEERRRLARDPQSDNYSLRSSADPVSDAALTDISSDATGHAACDIDYDCEQYECDSWDECEQDSFSFGIGDDTEINLRYINVLKI
ncbi:unnamed protein product [Leptidea sinapis]|uniref:Uncharacterized protein n=1 Tax=Leptidea sinapis TaxID=189913 RepID=A0A5E4PT07_9NEOP|nr:unnamed protein product [Leptidea sinapis]